jgi:hypothetical protein
LLLQDGVALEPIELLKDFGGLVVLDGAGIPTDLSTLKARQGPELDSARERALEMLNRAAEIALDQVRGVGELQGVWGTLWSNLPGRMGWKMAVIATLGFGYFVLPEPGFNKIARGVRPRFHADKGALLRRLTQLQAALVQVRGPSG